MSIMNSVQSGFGTANAYNPLAAGQGNPNNFSATEIKRQADRLKEQADVLVIKLSGASNLCSSIAATVKSEDSNLAGAWTKLGESFESIKKKYDSALGMMIQRMNEYSTKSIVNENVIEKGANAVGGVLDDIASFLQNIDL